MGMQYIMECHESPGDNVWRKMLKIRLGSGERVVPIDPQKTKWFVPLLGKI